MRLILICLALMLVSCGKKENSIGGSKPLPPFEQKSFLVLNTEEVKSGLRGQLLNSIVEESFPSDEASAMKKSYNELENVVMDEKDLKNYREKEKFMAKVVVSYPSRMEVYFLPERVLLSEIISSLQLSPEGSRLFKWVKTDHFKTYTGGVFYLVNLNHEDLMENDQEFYEEEMNSDQSLFEKSQKLGAFRGALLEVDYDFYVQTLGVQTLQGRAMKCTKELREADMCRGCSYKKNMPSGNYERKEPGELGVLGVGIRLNGRMSSLAELKVQGEAAGHFNVRVELQDLKDVGAEIEMVRMNTPVYQVSSVAYELSPMCLGNYDTPVSLASRVDFKVKIKILGRGERLRAIRL